jgi:copper chaperone CopZ
MTRTILAILLLALTACEKPADTTPAAAATPAAAPATPAAEHRTGDRFVIAVSGMHCGNCERAITTGAMACQGVNGVTASASDEEVVLWVAPGTDIDAIKNKIASLGFAVEPDSEN